MISAPRFISLTCLALGLASCYVSSGRNPNAAPPPAAYGGNYAVPQSFPPPAAPPPAVQSQPFWAAWQMPMLPPPVSVASLQIPNAPPGWGNIPLPQWPGMPGLPGQPAPQNPQPNTAKKGLGCGVANVGGQAMLLDCMTPQYAVIPFASQYVVRRKAFNASPGHEGAEALPAVVDHRADGKEGPTRSQGPVGACTAFSFAAAVDHAMAASGGSPGNVSVMQAWARYHYPAMGDAASANKGKPLNTESAWSYDKKAACQWYSGPYCDCGSMLNTSCNQPIDSAKLSSIDKTENVKVTNITRLPDGDLSEIKAAVAKGQDVWFAMYVDDSFQTVKGSPAVVPDGDFRSAGSGHAMVIAGYKTQPNGTYYLLHNSWGTGWGENGYAWIHENTLSKNIKYSYLVDVSTPSGGGTKPNQPGEPTPPMPNASNCPAGTVPDSGIPICLPACPDGSPRHFNACPAGGGGGGGGQQATGCPPGKVNIFGFCVNSPVVGSGTDAATGVRHTCGAGGCTYFVPQGVGGCSQSVCTRSCPAPKYLLTTGQFGLGCSS